MEARKGVLLFVGVALAAIEGVVLISQNLIVYTETVRIPLIGGGVFGLFTGAIVALLSQSTRRETIAVGILGFVGLYLFYDIVAGEREFPGRGLALFVCSFVFFGALLYLTTTFARAMAFPWSKPEGTKIRRGRSRPD